MTGHLSLWTIYDHPTDYPDHFVAREFRVNGGQTIVTNNLMISDNLEALRRTLLVDMHKTCLSRNDEDDKKIVETWL